MAIGSKRCKPFELDCSVTVNIFIFIYKHRIKHYITVVTLGKNGNKYWWML
jgi:hypothetical protein